MALSEEMQAEIIVAVEASTPEPEMSDEVSGEAEAEAEAEAPEAGDGEGEAGEVTGDIESDKVVEGSGDEDEGDESLSGGDQTARPDPIALSDELVAAAVRAGVPPRVAMRHESDEELSATIASITDTFVVEEPEAVEEKKELEFPTLDPEEYNPEVAKAFEQMKAIIEKQQAEIDGVRDGQQQAESNSKERAASDTVAWFDKQVEGLGDEFETVLGKGGYNDQAQGSPTYIKRDSIARQMSVMLAGYRATGQKMPSNKEAFDVAVKLVLSDDIEAAKKMKLSKKLATRGKQHINRAGGKKSAPIGDPEDDTVALLNKRFGTN